MAKSFRKRRTCPSGIRVKISLLCGLPEMNRSSAIPLWRNVPPEGCPTAAMRLGANFVFPSGRQALAFAVRRVGLDRRDRIALPEWSSHCVISAVSWHATPVPMREVLEFGIPVQAVLVYEQWGWPFCRGAFSE